jgi:CTP synthase (UTP-ammonia lyase)
MQPHTSLYERRSHSAYVHTEAHLLNLLSNAELAACPTPPQVLRSVGLTPHFLACRSEKPLEEGTKEKLSQFCHVPPEHIIAMHDLSNIWHVPLLLRNQLMERSMLKTLGLPPPVEDIDLSAWEERAQNWDKFKRVCKIAMVGKVRVQRAQDRVESGPSAAEKQLHLIYAR